MDTNKIKASPRRVLMEQTQADLVANLTTRLKKRGCKADTSKVVNQILTLFFEKYEQSDFKVVEQKLFDRKSYLLNLVKNGTAEEIDNSLHEYLRSVKTKKKTGRVLKKVIDDKS